MSTETPLLDYIAERDKAMAQVERNAGQEFRDAAREFVPGWLWQHGPASSEAITDACKAAGIVPHDDRAFGGIYAWLAKQGHIVWVGPCERVKGHGAFGGSIWRAKE